MHHTILPLFCAIFLLSQLACHSAADRNVSFQDVARNRFGRNVEFVPNADSSFFLCIHRDDTQAPLVRLAFFVWDRRTATVLFQDSLMQAEVFWTDPTHVRVVSSPEASMGNQPPDNGYVLDVVNGNKVNNQTLESQP